MAAAMQMKTRNKADAFDIFVGIRLRQLREKHDESQVVFGKRIGVTFQQIQKYERGINRLSHQHVYELCRQFDIPMTYFTDGFEDGPVITLPFAVPIEPEVSLITNKGGFMKLHIETMTCGGCARGVTKAIQSLDMKAQVKANPPTRSVEVETSASEAEILAALSKAGYPAKVA